MNKESKYINNLAVAKFRQFCRSNGLDFYFPDENPDDRFDTEFIAKQSSLIEQALNLFNSTNPCIFKAENVIDFHFVSVMPGDIKYTINSMFDLKKENEKLTLENERMSKLHYISLVVGTIASMIVALWVVNRLQSYFDPLNQYSYPWMILSWVVGVAVLLNGLIAETLLTKSAAWREKRKKVEFEQSIAEVRNNLGKLKNT